MKLRQFNESEIDVWPAFTDFLTSVLFIVVLFVLGVFFTNLSRSMLADNYAYRAMQDRQRRVQEELVKLGGIEVPVADGNLQRIILKVDEGGSGGVLFDRGQAVLKREGAPFLDKIVSVLVANKDAYDTIQVEGHTDDTPIRVSGGSADYSNWELSAARAGAVVNYILRKQPQLEPWRFSASGRAEYRPYGVAENSMNLDQAPNQRQGPNLEYVVRANGGDQLKDNPLAQRNRRIEIILTYKVHSVVNNNSR